MSTFNSALFGGSLTGAAGASGLPALDIIYQALRIIGFSRAGQTASPEAFADGLAALNRLIDSSNIKRGSIYMMQIDTYTLVAGTQAYTIGPGGDFDAANPVRISRANMLLPSGSSVVRRKLNLLDDKQWAAKKFLAARGLPYDLYNDNDNPLSVYSFYPIPSQAYQFETYTWKLAGAIATTDTLIAVSPGYYEWWLYELAARLAPIFGMKLPDDAAVILADARAAVRSMNCPSPRIRSNGDLPGGGGRNFNWLDLSDGGE